VVGKILKQIRTQRTKIKQESYIFFLKTTCWVVSRKMSRCMSIQIGFGEFLLKCNAHDLDFLEVFQ
jgi:hypothetical protein